MMPVFIELTYNKNDEKIVINADCIETIHEKITDEGKIISEIVIRPNVTVIPIKETPDQILDKIRRASMMATKNIADELNALGYIHP